MRELCSAVDIDASLERVWLIATHFAAYPQWNHFTPRMYGDLIPGAPLEIGIRLLGNRQITLKGRVLVVQAAYSFQWFGSLWLPGLADAECITTVQPRGRERTQFAQNVRLMGAFAPTLFGTGSHVLQSLEDTHHALKAHAEMGARARLRRLEGGR